MTLGWLFLLVFARAGYILFYNLDYFLKNPDQIFSIWNGGMAFHGAYWSYHIANDIESFD